MMWLSKKEIESISAAVFRRYKALPCFAGREVRKVDPELLANALFGLRIVYVHLSPDRHILGATTICDSISVAIYNEVGHKFYYEMDGKTILIESDLQDDPKKHGRQNYSIMHEVAHQIICRMFETQDAMVMKRVLYYRTGPNEHNDRNWEEWQAETMAAALLLNPDCVRSALREFGLGNGIDVLNPVFRVKEYKKFCAIADYLGASKQALAIRLKDFGLLKKDYLRNPYEMLDVWDASFRP